MNISETYDYLVRTRRDLWSALEGAEPDVLANPLLTGSRMHCIKDLVFHIAAVEDFWLHEDILRTEPLLNNFSALKDTEWGPVFGNVALEKLLNYWRLVEQGTLAFLEELKDDPAKQVVPLHDAPDERYTLDGLLWHVMLHEIRHTAQIVLLLRLQGIKPPSLDLLFYLRRA